MGTVGTRNRARNRTRHVAHSSLPYCFQHDACTAMLHAQPMHGLANSVSSPCSWQMMHIVGASAYTALRGARTYTCLVNGSYPAKNSIFGMIYPRTHACTKSAASRLAATTMDVQYTASSAPNVWYDRITPPRAGVGTPPPAPPPVGWGARLGHVRVHSLARRAHVHLLGKWVVPRVELHFRYGSGGRRVATRHNPLTTMQTAMPAKNPNVMRNTVIPNHRKTVSAGTSSITSSVPRMPRARQRTRCRVRGGSLARFLRATRSSVVWY